MKIKRKISCGEDLDVHGLPAQFQCPSDLTICFDITSRCNKTSECPKGEDVQDVKFSNASVIINVLVIYLNATVKKIVPQFLWILGLLADGTCITNTKSAIERRIVQIVMMRALCVTMRAQVLYP